MFVIRFGQPDEIKILFQPNVDLLFDLSKVYFIEDFNLLDTRMFSQLDDPEQAKKDFEQFGIQYNGTYYFIPKNLQFALKVNPHTRILTVSKNGVDIELGDLSDYDSTSTATIMGSNTDLASKCAIAAKSLGKSLEDVYTDIQYYMEFFDIK